MKDYALLFRFCSRIKCFGVRETVEEHERDLPNARGEQHSDGRVRSMPL